MWLLHCKDYPRTAFEVNIRGTFNVLEACVRHNVKKLVWSSSASVYGDAVELPMKENHPLNSINFYGATKISGEVMAKAFHYQFALPVISLRYMNVYGPNQDQFSEYTGIIPKLLNQIDANIAPTIYGDGSQEFDFIYVQDVARCNICALKSDIEFGVYNVATQINTSLKDLVRLILEIKKSSLNPEFIPYEENDSRRLINNRIGFKYNALSDLGFNHTWKLEIGIKELIKWRVNNQIGI